jgi:hydroxyacylglutathione hydrolase
MYFAEMKRINRDGPPLLGGLRPPPLLPDSRLDGLLAESATVVDTRPRPEFARRHVPGTLSVPLGKSFSTWAGSVAPYGRPLYLVASEAGAAEAARDLALIGLDGVQGRFAPEAVDAWVDRFGQAGAVADVTPEEMEQRRLTGKVELVDVRNSSEFGAGHLAGARNVPLGRLAERLGELPRDRTLVVHCQSGARAGVAVSLLQASGFRDVLHLDGDFAGWKAAGRPVDTGRAAATAAL